MTIKDFVNRDLEFSGYVYKYNEKTNTIDRFKKYTENTKTIRIFTDDENIEWLRDIEDYECTSFQNQKEKAIRQFEADIRSIQRQIDKLDASISEKRLKIRELNLLKDE